MYSKKEHDSYSAQLTSLLDSLDIGEWSFGNGDI